MGTAVDVEKKQESRSATNRTTSGRQDIKHFIAVLMKEKGLDAVEANFLFLRGTPYDVLADCPNERWVGRIIKSGISLEERKIYFSQLLGVSPTTVVDLIDRARRDNSLERASIRASIKAAITGRR